MGMMKLGPVGDCRDRISHIFVSFDDKYLTSIQFGYVKNGAVVLSKKHGSSNSTSTRIVRQNHVSEFVTGISGECYKDNILSLTFHTNQRTHEAFRTATNILGFKIISNKKREFHSGMHDRREFAGFFGSCSSYRLYSIGLYLKPILPAVPSLFVQYVPPGFVHYKSLSFSEMIPVGPIGWKNRSGQGNWDEKGNNTISYIYVTFNDKYITSIQFSYFHEEAQIVSKEYYGLDYFYVEKHRMIRLNQDEYVTGLSAIHWGAALTSLTFHTNQRKHGPICERFDHIKDGYMKEIDVGICDPREFGGFFGSFCHVSGYLTSIGLYVCPITRINDAALKTNYKVTDDDDESDQLTVYQSSGPLTTINHNRTLEYQMPHEVSDSYHVKPIVHKPKFENEISLYQSSDLLARSTNSYHVKPIVHNPKFEDEISLYQSPDRLARSTNNRTLEYQNLEFLDAFHRVKSIGRKPKLKKSIFSKLGRLLKNLLD